MDEVFDWADESSSTEVEFEKESNKKWKSEKIQLEKKPKKRWRLKRIQPTIEGQRRADEYYDKN